MTAPATMTIHPQFEWGAGQPEAVYAEPIEALATQVANHAASWTTAPDELDLADMWREIDETARFDGWVLDTGFETLPIVYADPQRRRQRAAEARSHE
ncbi:hypothetical protein [Rhodococcus tukisamuensis]|nr:hypothetical protein [Rhodococcus tukisamuensis]